jgi:hypothetical protein
VQIAFIAPSSKAFADFVNAMELEMELDAECP